jgi:hypothetical protein
VSENNVSFPALYVAVGRDQDWIALKYTQVFLLGLAAFLVLLVGVVGSETWLKSTLGFTDAGLLALKIGPALAAPLALSYFASRYTAARSGLAQFSPWGVAIQKPRGYSVAPAETRLPWSEVRSYRDRSSEFVELLCQGDRFARRALTVPTLNEETRTAVLHLLDGHGVPREE